MGELFDADVPWVSGKEFQEHPFGRGDPATGGPDGFNTVIDGR